MATMATARPFDLTGNMGLAPKAMTIDGFRLGRTFSEQG